MVECHTGSFTCSGSLMMDSEIGTRKIREDLLKVGRSKGQGKRTLSRRNSMCRGRDVAAWHVWKIPSSSVGVKSRVHMNEGMVRFGTRAISFHHHLFLSLSLSVSRTDTHIHFVLYQLVSPHQHKTSAVPLPLCFTVPFFTS